MEVIYCNAMLYSIHLTRQLVWQSRIQSSPTTLSFKRRILQNVFNHWLSLIIQIQTNKDLSVHRTYSDYVSKGDNRPNKCTQRLFIIVKEEMWLCIFFGFGWDSDMWKCWVYYGQLKKQFWELKWTSKEK